MTSYFCSYCNTYHLNDLYEAQPREQITINKLRVCTFCKNIGKKYLCGGCKLAQYCNKTCQIFDWNNHKFLCLGIPNPNLQSQSHLHPSK